MKVKELIEKLLNMPQDAELVAFQHDIEKSGIMPVFYNPKLRKYTKKSKLTGDRFDYGKYSYDTYVRDKNGEIEAVEM